MGDVGVPLVSGNEVRVSFVRGSLESMGLWLGAGHLVAVLHERTSSNIKSVSAVSMSRMVIIWLKVLNFSVCC